MTGKDTPRKYFSVYKAQLNRKAIERYYQKGNPKKYVKIEVTLFCRRCSKPILEMDWIIHRGHGKLYHKKCWDELRI